MGLTITILIFVELASFSFSFWYIFLAPNRRSGEVMKWKFLFALLRVWAAGWMTGTGTIYQTFKRAF